jgi:hypothetical protein
MTMLLLLCVASALLLLSTRAQQKSFNEQCKQCLLSRGAWCVVDCAADAEGGERFCAKQITCDPEEDASDSPRATTRDCAIEAIFTDDVPFKPKCPRILAARATSAAAASPIGPSLRSTTPPSTPADEDTTVGIVIGSVIGGVLLLGICIGAFVFLALKRKKAPAPTNVAVNVQQQTTAHVSESDESESAKTPQYVEQVAASSSSESEEKATPAPVRSSSSSGRNKKKKKTTSADEDSKYAKQIGAESSSSGPPD